MRFSLWSMFVILSACAMIAAWTSLHLRRASNEIDALERKRERQQRVIGSLENRIEEHSTEVFWKWRKKRFIMQHELEWYRQEKENDKRKKARLTETLKTNQDRLSSIEADLYVTIEQQVILKARTVGVVVPFSTAILACIGIATIIDTLKRQRRYGQQRVPAEFGCGESP